MASIKDRRTQLNKDGDEFVALNAALNSVKGSKGNKVLIRQITTRHNVLKRRIERETKAIETVEHGTARERVLKDVNKRLAALDPPILDIINDLPTTFFQGMRGGADWNTLAATYETEVEQATQRQAMALTIADAYEDGAFVLVRNGTGPLTVRYGRTRKAKEA